MSLLDLNNKEYVLNWETYFDYGIPGLGDKGLILNQDQSEIGGFLFTKNRLEGYSLSLFDKGGTIDVSNSKKNLSIVATRVGKWRRKIIRITDNENKVLGFARKKGIIDRKIFFTNSQDHEILFSNPKEGTILDLNDKTIAEYSLSQEKIKEGKGILKHILIKRKYKLKILDESFDRRVLLGFFSAILDHILPNVVLLD